MISEQLRPAAWRQVHTLLQSNLAKGKNRGLSRPRLGHFKAHDCTETAEHGSPRRLHEVPSYHFESIHYYRMVCKFKCHILQVELAWYHFAIQYGKVLYTVHSPARVGA